MGERGEEVGVDKHGVEGGGFLFFEELGEAAEGARGVEGVGHVERVDGDVGGGELFRNGLIFDFRFLIFDLFRGEWFEGDDGELDVVGVQCEGEVAEEKWGAAEVEVGDEEGEGERACWHRGIMTE
jgi:hypothetical protein